MYTDPELREALKRRILQGSKGGRPGQWSARKAQLLAHEYEAHGGSYRGRKTSAQRSLSKWSREAWGTRSGRNSVQGRRASGERYLPRRLLRRLSKRDYDATTRAKRRSLRAGAQYSAQPAGVSRRIRELEHGGSVTDRAARSS
jgi:hypothetical protein